MLPIPGSSHFLEGAFSLAHARASLAVSCSVLPRTVPSKPGQRGAKPATPCAGLVDGPTPRAPLPTVRREWFISPRKRPRLFTPLCTPSYPICSAGAEPRRAAAAAEPERGQLAPVSVRDRGARGMLGSGRYGTAA